MTTPGTAEVRAWARAQGIAVAERGRVPAEVHEAYHASTSGKPAAAPGAARSTATASAGKPAVRKAAAEAPARKASAKARATKAPARKAPARKAPARKAPASKAPASKAPVSKAPVTASPVPASKAPAASTGTSSAAGPEVSTTVTAPSGARPAPVPPVDDGRLERLQEQVLALTARVVELEKPQAPKAALFRRRKG